MSKHIEVNYKQLMMADNLVAIHTIKVLVPKILSQAKLDYIKLELNYNC